MRKDKNFVGTEEIGPEPLDNELLIEAALFLLIGAGCIAFFLALAGSTKTLSRLFVFLALSPFGAHLMARCLAYILKVIKCVIPSCEK